MKTFKFLKRENFGQLGMEDWEGVLSGSLVENNLFETKYGDEAK